MKEVKRAELEIIDVQDKDVDVPSWAFYLINSAEGLDVMLPLIRTGLPLAAPSSEGEGCAVWSS